VLQNQVHFSLKRSGRLRQNSFVGHYRQSVIVYTLTCFTEILGEEIRERSVYPILLLLNNAPFHRVEKLPLNNPSGIEELIHSMHLHEPWICIQAVFVIKSK
jgi:hypothetical protein